MEMTTLMRYLATAEEHVRQGERQIAQQRTVLEELERDGHGSVAVARALLRQFEALQERLAEHRDMVRDELQARTARGRLLNNL